MKSENLNFLEPSGHLRACNGNTLPLPLNAPCPYMQYWPENGSLEPKHVANYALMTIYVLCLTEKNTLSYCTTQRGGSYQNFS